MPTPEQIQKQMEQFSREPMPPLSKSHVVSRRTRFCWWLSRKLGGRSVFGKQDLTDA